MLLRTFGLHLFVLLLLSCPTHSQDMTRVKAHIDTLCSPFFEGRGYVNQGDIKTVRYLRDEFKKIGLESFENRFLQRFELNINTFPEKMRLKIHKTKLSAGADYIVNAISKSGQGKAKAIFLDTLIFSSEEAQADFLKQKTNNKALLYLQKDYSKIINLPKKVIDKIYEAEIIIELKSSKMVASLSQRQLSNPYFEVPQSLFDSLTQDLDKIKIKYRVDAELKQAYSSYNVIGYLPGTSQVDSFIVVSAHYDHLGKMGQDTYFPGANDNASGIAMLLELAHHFKKPENRLEYPLVFIAFGAEEVGLLGSLHYVKNPYFPLSKIRFLLNLDLVGTGDEGATVVNGSVYKKEFNRLLDFNQASQSLPKILSRGRAANSDHFFFSERGVPAFFLYTLGGITAYHDIYDRPETLPLTRFPELYQLLIQFMASF